jgi:hypothetical protein
MVREPWSPSDVRGGHSRAAVRRRVVGVHVIDTQARTFDDALAIIAARQEHARAVAARAAAPLSRAAMFARAAGRARLQKLRGEISLAPVYGSPSHNRSSVPPRRAKTAHPFAALRAAQGASKRALVRAMYATGNFNSTDLIRASGEDAETVLDWISDVSGGAGEAVPAASRAVIAERWPACVDCGGPGRDEYLGAPFCEACYGRIPFIQAARERRERARALVGMKRDADAMAKFVKRMVKEMGGNR